MIAARIVLLFCAILFGILSYSKSGDVVVQEFVVVEKVKTGDNLYLKYEKNPMRSEIYEATPTEFIDAVVGEEFAVYKEQMMFWVYAIACVLCTVILLVSLGIPVEDVLDIIT